MNIHSLPMAATAEKTKNKIIEKFRWDSRLTNITKISIDIQDGKVVLSGSIPSNLEKKSAQEDVYTIPGVAYVENQLKVAQEDQTALASDSDIKAQIEKAFELNHHIDGNKIRVTVKNAVAYLEGSIDSYWKKPFVEEIAQNITGVSDVINEATVIPTKKISDEAIAQRIMETISEIRNIKPESLTVQVVNGAVTLNGRLPDQNTAHILKKEISFTAGVTDLDDGLLIIG